jgi:hypothetical protein
VHRAGIDPFAFLSYCPFFSFFACAHACSCTECVCGVFVCVFAYCVSGSVPFHSFHLQAVPFCFRPCFV